MIWQDTLIGACSLGFSIMLIPSIVGNSKPAVLTSMGTSLLLVGTLIAYIYLGLWFSSITTFLTLTGWAVLLYQSLVEWVLRRN